MEWSIVEEPHESQTQCCVLVVAPVRVLVVPCTSMSSTHMLMGWTWCEAFIGVFIGDTGTGTRLWILACGGDADDAIFIPVGVRCWVLCCILIVWRIAWAWRIACWIRTPMLEIPASVLCRFPVLERVVLLLEEVTCDCAAASTCICIVVCILVCCGSRFKFISQCCMGIGWDSISTNVRTRLADMMMCVIRLGRFDFGRFLERRDSLSISNSNFALGCNGRSWQYGIVLCC